METRGITFQMLQFICEHAYSDDRKLYCRYRDFCDAFKKAGSRELVSIEDDAA